MSAYLQTLIQGNQNFGGYISVDGEKAFAVQHDMTYEITPGIHIITIYSTSNFERASGNVQKFAYNHSSSSGAVMDTLAKASAIKSLGDEWSIQIEISENEICEITNVSKGSKLIGDPMYRVRELSAEEVTMYEEKFEEWRNTPVRSKKKMTWGAILAVCGVVLIGQAGETFAGQSAGTVAGGMAMYVAMIAIGVLLFISGFKKKIRRK